MKPVYFLSDAHLGSLAIHHQRTQERRLVNFLDSIKNKASAVYLLGDIFDFWHEYRTVVPRGYTRLLGKLSELTDNGVEVHFFIGNHDLWQNGYLTEECGITVHREGCAMEIGGKVFFLAHGDGLGTRDHKFLILRHIFHNRLCRALFAALHPRWGMAFGLGWARHSQLKHQQQGEPRYKGENREELMLFAREYAHTHPEINYFVFGHRHIQHDVSLHNGARVLFIGDWITRYTFARFDGQTLTMDNYIEGQTEA